MARYEETRGTGNALVHMAPWLAAGYFSGKEAQMARAATPAAAEALRIARTKGIFRASAWRAAKSSKVIGSLAKIAASRAAGLYFTAWNIGIFAQPIYSGVKGAVNTLRDIGRRSMSLDFGGDYIDTRGAYTERQRSLRAITSSRMSTRAAIGNEALLMHR